tara:strand:- start:1145 stop:1852 length:708 start_codon:yes stop_codon:yes gene_type:complete
MEPITASLAAIGFGAATAVPTAGALATAGAAAGTFTGVTTTAIAGGGFFSGVGAFLTSPAFALGTSAIGFGVSLIGPSYANNIANQQIDIRRELIKNNIALGKQKKVELRERFEAQREITGFQTRRDIGEAKVAAAGLGQVLEPDNPGTVASGDIGAEAAFADQLAFYNLQATEKEIDDAAGNSAFDIALLNNQSRSANNLLSLKRATSTVKFAGGLSKFNINRDGNLTFAPRRA